MIKSILLAVDGSVYTHSVVDHGIGLARKLDAFLRIVTVVDIRIYEWVLNTGGEGYMPVLPSNVFHDESYKFHSERADGLIVSLRKKMESSGLRFEAEKIEGSPVEIINDISRQVDLVIMGARGDYARWGGRMLGATLEPVSHQSHSPLMIVDKTFIDFKTIICAYDRSESSNNSLRLSAYLATHLLLPVEVLTINDDENEREETVEEARTYLKAYDLKTKFRLETGDVSKSITQATIDVTEPTLLMMGSYGHSRIREAILGSTTLEVMRNASKPILLSK
jgi:nucleotide-binding universal stress UspA family protein